MLNEIDSFEEIKNIEIWLLKNELKIIKQNFSEEIKILFTEAKKKNIDKKNDYLAQKQKISDKIQIILQKIINLNNKTHLCSSEIANFEITNTEFDEYKNFFEKYENLGNYIREIKMKLKTNTQNIPKLETKNFNAINNFDLAKGKYFEFNEHVKEIIEKFKKQMKLKEKNRLKYQIDNREKEDKVKIFKMKIQAIYTNIENFDEEIERAEQNIIKFDLEISKKNSSFNILTKSKSKNLIDHEKEIQKLKISSENAQKNLADFRIKFNSADENFGIINGSHDSHHLQFSFTDEEINHIRSELITLDSEYKQASESTRSKIFSQKMMQDQINDFHEQIKNSFKERNNITLGSNRKIKKLQELLKPSDGILAEKDRARSDIKYLYATERFKIDEIEKKIYTQKSKIMAENHQCEIDTHILTMDNAKNIENLDEINSTIEKLRQCLDFLNRDNICQIARIKIISDQKIQKMYLKRKRNLIKQIKNLNYKKEFKHYLERHFDLHKRNEKFKIELKSLIEEKKLQQIEISAKIQRYSDLCNQNKSNKLNDKIYITTPQFKALKSNLDGIKNLKSFLNSLKKENDTKYRVILKFYKDVSIE